MAAEAGDAAAMRMHGRRLFEAATTGDNVDEAVGWLRRAAEGGDVAAMTDMGELLAFGAGVPRDPNEALDWLGRAAEQGSARAGDLGRLLSLGEK